MMITKRKQAVAAISVATLFLLVGSAYGFVKNQTKSNKPLIKEAEANQVAEAVPLQQQVADAPVEQAVTAESSPAQSVTVEASQPLAVNTKSTVATEAVSIKSESVSKYPMHRNISTTYFWAGEEAGADNKNISNLPSAWDEQWVKHFGGVDNPKKRNGYVVASFTPKENSFYFALPYNDFDDNGNRKKDVNKVIPWASSKKWAATESICKNQWIKVVKGGKVAYAQWQDVGPYGEDDSAYVFGGKAPSSKSNESAGLDVSPAVRDFLGLGDVDRTDWQFVDASQVPDGPWKKTITHSQIYWN